MHTEWNRRSPTRQDSARQSGSHADYDQHGRDGYHFEGQPHSSSRTHRGEKAESGGCSNSSGNDFSDERFQQQHHHQRDVPPPPPWDHTPATAGYHPPSLASWRMGASSNKHSTTAADGPRGFDFAGNEAGSNTGRRSHNQQQQRHPPQTNFHDQHHPPSSIYDYQRNDLNMSGITAKTPINSRSGFSTDRPPGTVTAFLGGLFGRRRSLHRQESASGVGDTMLPGRPSDNIGTHPYNGQQSHQSHIQHYAQGDGLMTPPSAPGGALSAQNKQQTQGFSQQQNNLSKTGHRPQRTRSYNDRESSYGNNPRSRNSRQGIASGDITFNRGSRVAESERRHHKKDGGRRSSFLGRLLSHRGSQSTAPSDPSHPQSHQFIAQESILTASQRRASAGAAGTNRPEGMRSSSSLSSGDAIIEPMSFEECIMRLDSRGTMVLGQDEEEELKLETTPLSAHLRYFSEWASNSDKDHLGIKVLDRHDPNFDPAASIGAALCPHVLDFDKVYESWNQYYPRLEVDEEEAEDVEMDDDADTSATGDDITALGLDGDLEDDEGVDVDEQHLLIEDDSEGFVDENDDYDHEEDRVEEEEEEEEAFSKEESGEVSESSQSVKLLSADGLEHPASPPPHEETLPDFSTVAAMDSNPDLEAILPPGVAPPDADVTDNDIVGDATELCDLSADLPPPPTPLLSSHSPVEIGEEIERERPELTALDEAELPPPDEAELPPPDEAELPPSMEAELPPSKEAELPPSKEAELPLSEEAKLPPSKEAELPHSFEAELPPPDEAELPPSKETELPPSEEAELPPSKEAELPLSKETELPPSKEAELPPSSEAELPPSIVEKLPPSHKTEVPPPKAELPPLNEAELPPSNVDELPLLNEAQLLLSNVDELPPSNEIKVPPLLEAELPLSSKAEVPEGNTPVPLELHLASEVLPEVSSPKLPEVSPQKRPESPPPKPQEVPPQELREVPPPESLEGLPQKLPDMSSPELLSPTGSGEIPSSNVTESSLPREAAQQEVADDRSDLITTPQMELPKDLAGELSELASDRSLASREAQSEQKSPLQSAAHDVEKKMSSGGLEKAADILEELETTRGDIPQLVECEQNKGRDVSPPPSSLEHTDVCDGSPTTIAKEDLATPSGAGVQSAPNEVTEVKVCTPEIASPEAEQPEIGRKEAPADSETNPSDSADIPDDSPAASTAESRSLISLASRIGEAAAALSPESTPPKSNAASPLSSERSEGTLGVKPSPDANTKDLLSAPQSVVLEGGSQEGLSSKPLAEMSARSLPAEPSETELTTDGFRCAKDTSPSTSNSIKRRTSDDDLPLPEGLRDFDQPSPLRSVGGSSPPRKSLETVRCEWLDTWASFHLLPPPERRTPEFLKISLRKRREPMPLERFAEFHRGSMQADTDTNDEITRVSKGGAVTICGYLQSAKVGEDAATESSFTPLRRVASDPSFSVADGQSFWNVAMAGTNDATATGGRAGEDETDESQAYRQPWSKVESGRERRSRTSPVSRSSTPRSMGDTQASQSPGSVTLQHVDRDKRPVQNFHEEAAVQFAKHIEAIRLRSAGRHGVTVKPSDNGVTPQVALSSAERDPLQRRLNLKRTGRLEQFTAQALAPETKDLEEFSASSTPSTGSQKLSTFTSSPTFPRKAIPLLSSPGPLQSQQHSESSKEGLIKYLPQSVQEGLQGSPLIGAKSDFESIMPSGSLSAARVVGPLKAAASPSLSLSSTTASSPVAELNTVTTGDVTEDKSQTEQGSSIQPSQQSKLLPTYMSKQTRSTSSGSGPIITGISFIEKSRGGPSTTGGAVGRGAATGGSKVPLRSPTESGGKPEFLKIQLKRTGRLSAKSGATNNDSSTEPSQMSSTTKSEKMEASTAPAAALDATSDCLSVSGAATPDKVTPVDATKLQATGDGVVAPSVARSLFEARARAQEVQKSQAAAKHKPGAANRRKLNGQPSDNWFLQQVNKYNKV